MESYKKINNVAGWLVFLFAAIVYTMTLESSGSFWDCGEFVPCCFKLQVPHSPGAPFFVILGRLFTFLAMGDVTKVAFMVNFMSGISTAFSIMFCYWSVTLLASKFFFKNKDTDYTTSNIVSVVGAGVIAATCATFLDSLWFSAVEGEVYALSQFFLGFIVWAILKWDSLDEKYADKWLVLIAYMVGLSIGVHLLSLLAIPFIALVYYYKRSTKPNFLGFILASAIGFLILGFAMKFVISYTQSFMAGFDKLFVNNFGMPFWSGAFVFILNLSAVLITGIYVTQFVSKSRMANVAFLCAAFMYIGYMSYALIPIRASINPPIDMGRPTDPFAIKSYVDRDQYGDRPLVWGPDYTATGQDIEKTVEIGEKWYRSKDKYAFGGKKYDYKFKDEACMFFPRMGFWQEEQKKAGYKVWLNPGSKLIDRKSDQVVQVFEPGQQDMAEQTLKQHNATEPGRYMLKDEIGMKENISYFLKYQVGYMFFRYFMWNFAGRQDDIQGTYANDNGRWICGIPFIDNLGGAFFTPVYPQDHLSQTIAANKGRNKFYLIPMILGLIGLVYTLYKNEKVFLCMLVLFAVTGVLQIVYQNEPPIEPRERDYALAGAFWAYCFWIGFGVLAIIDLLRTLIKENHVAVVAAVLAVCASAPYLMGSQGWDDHTRHDRYTARDFATDYLQSCAPNALLFTQGDNDTYPLWYAQEVEHVRPDVRVINLSLIGVDWYIEQLKYKWNDAPAVKTSFKDEQIEGNNRDVTRYSNAAGIPDNAYVELKRVMQFIASEDPSKKVTSPNTGELESYIPAKNVFIEIDTNKVKAMDWVALEDMGKVVPRMQWTIGSTLLKNDLLTLDMVANNIMDRPIYFAVSVAPDAYVGLDKYFQLEGMAYRVVPIENTSRNAQSCPVRSDVTYKNMMEKFRFGGIKENKNIYLDENILRMTMNLRGNYARLAQVLLEKGEKDKAAKAIDHAIEEMPKDRVPYNIFVAMYPEIYYSAGQGDKAKKLSGDIWATAKNEINYYLYVDSTLMKRAKDGGDMTYYNVSKQMFDLERVRADEDKDKISSMVYYNQLAEGQFMQNRSVQEYLYIMQELTQTAKKFETPAVADAMEQEFRVLQFSFVPAQKQQMLQQMQNKKGADPAQ